MCSGAHICILALGKPDQHQMDSGDFDIRFMAMKDLMTELQREGFRLDERMQNMVSVHLAWSCGMPPSHVDSG